MSADVTIILPAHDECASLQAWLPELHTVATDRDAQILVIDDGSTDGTWSWLKSLGDARISAVRLGRNYGQAIATAAGIAHVRTPCVLPVDADFQVLPSDVDALLAYHTQYALTDNARCLIIPKLVRMQRKLPLPGRGFSWLGNSILRYLSGIAVQDFGCTSGVFPVRFLRQIPCGLPHFHRYLPWIASVVAAEESTNLSFKSLYVEEQDRAYGSSHYNMAKILGVPVQILHMMQYASGRGGSFVTVEDLVAGKVVATIGLGS